MSEKLTFNALNEFLSGNTRLQSVLDMPKVSIIVLDKSGKLIFSNKYMCEILGILRDEITGIDWFEKFVPAKEANKVKAKFFEYIKGGSTDFENIEIPVICKSGEEIVFQWNNVAIIEKNNAINKIICFGFNISEYKKEEKIKDIISDILQAANSESNLNELFKYIHASIGKVMPVENFYIALYNRESGMITFPHFIDKIDRVAPPKRFGNGLTEYVLKNGISILIDEKKDEDLVRKGEVELIGSPARIWLGVPLKIKENTIGVLVVQDYDDVNAYTEKDQKTLELLAYPISYAIERKRVENEKNKLIEKLSELNASKDKLISIISHDLRSPFNSLLGFSEILTTEYDSLTHDEILEYQKAIYEASKNLYSMTTNLLHYSRFQMGRFEYNPVKIKLIKIINGALNILKGNALKKQLNLTVEVDKAIEVLADEDMLNSIVQNVISNAIKFTNRGGDIKIIANVITATDNKQMAEVAVQDTGVGINKDDLEKINKDVIFSSPGTDREYGTGLGLLLVKEYIEKNKGYVRIHSKLNYGTTFTFALPVV